MAIYHLSVQIISRGKGKSCVASSAYRAGEKLHDERQNINHNYTKKHDIESEIIAPDNSPTWVYNREELWNEVDKKETRCNARTAREINVALPIELSREQQKELAREYVKNNFVNKGMIADLCFHFNDTNNPHFHVMLTTREINENGFTKKNRDWDKKENIENWREQWSISANKALEKVNSEKRIDHRSYKEQNIEQVPTIHLGKTSSEMNKKGIENIRVELNKKIKDMNKQKVIALQEYRELKNKLEKINTKEKQSNNLTDEEKIFIKSVEDMIYKPLTFESARESLEFLEEKKSELSTLLSKVSDNKKMDTLKDNMKSLNYASDRIKTAVEILKNNEIRAFINEYSNIFPKDKYKFKYDEIKSIKEVYKTTKKSIDKNQMIDIGIFGEAEMKKIEKELSLYKNNPPKQLLNDKKEILSSLELLQSAVEGIERAEKRSQEQQLKDRHKDMSL